MDHPDEEQCFSLLRDMDLVDDTGHYNYDIAEFEEPMIGAQHLINGLDGEMQVEVNAGGDTSYTGSGGSMQTTRCCCKSAEQQGGCSREEEMGSYFRYKT